MAGAKLIQLMMNFVEYQGSVIICCVVLDNFVNCTVLENIYDLDPEK